MRRSCAVPSIQESRPPALRDERPSNCAAHQPPPERHRAADHGAAPVAPGAARPHDPQPEPPSFEPRVKFQTLTEGKNLTRQGRRFQQRYCTTENYGAHATAICDTLGDRACDHQLEVGNGVPDLLGANHRWRDRARQFGRGVNSLPRQAKASRAPIARHRVWEPRPIDTIPLEMSSRL